MWKMMKTIPAYGGGVINKVNQWWNAMLGTKNVKMDGFDLITVDYEALHVAQITTLC